MSWGRLGEDGLVSWKRGTHLGALLSQTSAPLALERWWGAALPAPHGTWKMG